MPRAILRASVAALALFVTACPRAKTIDPPPPSPSSSAATWQARISIPADLDRITVEMRVDRAQQLVIDDDGARFVRDLQPLEGARKIEEGPWKIACDGPCRYRYRFALHEAAAAANDPETAIARGGAVAAPMSTWLLHPAIDRDARGTMHIEVIEGSDRFATPTFDVPFDGLDESTFTAFGDFHRAGLKVGPASVDLAIFPQDQHVDDDAVAHWIGTDANVIANGFGRFPVDRLLVVAMSNEGDGPTRGVTLGGGGAAIVVRIGKKVEASTVLRDDWVVTHEMVHVGSPDLPRDQIWFSEGVASYIEPFWRARAGLIDAERVWRDLVDGMPQGEPEAGDQGLDGTHSWGRIYWGGAMFCLLADLRIREATSNARSLDDVLRAVNAKGGDVRASWSFEHFLDVGDDATKTRVLHELYAQWGHAPVSVDLPALWKKLGVAVGATSVSFDDAAPLGKIRRSMTAPPS